MDNDFSNVQSAISAALVSTTRSASSLASEDLPFHRSLDSSLASRLDRQNARLLGLATGLLGSATAATETVRPPTSLKDVDGIESNWRTVVDVVDSLLERADTALDEFTGAVRRMSPGVDAQGATGSRPMTSKIAAQLKAQDMEKPQLQFEHITTNREARPFKPLLTAKPHSLAPLATEPVPTDEDSQSQYAAHLFIYSPLGLDHKHKRLKTKASRMKHTGSNVATRYPHPYQLEIEQYRYPASMYTEADPIPYHPFDSTTATLVDTEESLDEMLQELTKAKEIAVDLEHHDQRSYIGLVSLMQISTRDRDWVVDTLKPWRRKLEKLNEVFANPNIIKVLHGAYMDIVWLQRDLGLYVVGLFDTYFAARALGYAGASLAFLLKKFVNFDAQKQFQMADWRVRPLPKELFDYARSDTHFLLYIFDCMRNELIQRSDFSQPNHEGDKLWAVLQRSSETALQQYEHPVYDSELGQGPHGWYKMLKRTPAMFTKEQFSVFRAVHQWRDEVAREQDDSAHYVMPNHQIFSIARELPTNKASLLGVAQPTTQAVRLRADELLSVTLKAKEAGKEGPSIVDVLNKVEPLPSSGAVNSAPPSHSVAAFVPKASTAGTTHEGSGQDGTVLPLRSSRSTFWGGAFESSAHQHHRKRDMTAPSGVDLSVPLPALTAEVFADPADALSSTPVKPQPASEPEPTPAGKTEEDDDVFVMKDLGKKRKRAVNERPEMAVDGMAAQNDEVALPDEETERKAERKQAKKEARRAKKAAAEAEGANGVQEEEEPFDYASAPSMLHPPRESKAEMKARKKKEVNPYAKALDAPKGLPRAQKENAGRTMTYK